MDLLSKVGVLGGGRMGAGIAHAFCLAGCRVVVVERDVNSTAAAKSRIAVAVARSVEKGTTAEPLETLQSRISVTDDCRAFSDCDLVIEAVPEDAALKAAALTEVEQELGKHAWLATNTSALSVNELAAVLRRPERFCGLHFFNPVPSSALVEVVVGRETSDELTHNARAWVEALDKFPIVVKDSPGFASSRLGVALGLEAMRMVEDGVASPADIDTAMVLGYKHPVGPLRTGDIVGLDVRLGIANHLEASLGERFAAPQILLDMVARGDLGRKSGKGFFDWP